MIQKKICLLGAFSVGKTSLIKQFVSSMFDERYLTTVGVKIDKKLLKVGAQDLMLMIWDLAGEDAFNSVQTNYLRGAAGYILVVDGTRPNTADTALKIDATVEAAIGKKPCVVAFNKADLMDDWLITQDQQKAIMRKFPVLNTSAKTGANVENLFAELAGQML